MSDTLLDRRKQLLRQRLLDAGLTADAANPAAPVEPVMSPGQRRIWLRHNSDPTDTTLNISVAFQFTGPLDVNRLHAAFRAVVERHDVLRSTYALDDAGRPGRVVHEAVEIAWRSVDIGDIPEAGRARRLAVLMRRESGRPFDISTDLPIRVTLVRTSDAEHVLIMVIHHICWDDESWGAFFDDLNASYNGAPLAQIRGTAHQEDREPEPAAIDYWRAQLASLPQPLTFPGQTDHGSATAALCTKTLAPELVGRIRDTARRHATTPFVVLFAASDAALARLSGTTDFVTMVPVSQRRPHSSGVIGYFGNTLPVRCGVRLDSSFTEAVARKASDWTAALAQHDVGIDRILRELRNQRAGIDGVGALSGVAFSMRNDVNGFALEGISSTPLQLGRATAELPLEIAVVLNGHGGPVVEARFHPQAFDRRQVERILASYIELLDNAIQHPDERLDRLALTSAAEAKDLLRASQGVRTAYPAETLTELLERQAAQGPNRIAVIDDTTGKQWTYGELHSRAAQLAHWIIGQGIGPEQVVALELDGSADFIVAAIAVLHAGATYLPVDPAYPPQRIEYLTNDARPQLILDAPTFADACAAACSYPETAPNDADRIAPLLPDHLAYIIYTSGSTGAPKGVPVPHRAIAQHLRGVHADIGVTPADRVLHTSSVSFDASIFEIFATLTLGACVIIARPNGFRDLRYIAELVAREQVTVLHMVPSVLSTILQLPAVGGWQHVRHVPVGGEALPGEIADRFFSVFDAELSNNYGPTEGVVAATHFPVRGPQGTRTAPIGRPNRNVSLYILDGNLQLVPDGVAGEIYLGGDQLARGYLHRPGLSAQHFVADPFGHGTRLYRTGDVAYRNPDGDIVFQGRADDQVKIRGYRVELGEIEEAIEPHPEVARCVVLARSQGSADAALVAYIVGSDGSPTQTVLDEVRAAVARILPEHMVPASFVGLAEIPLTAHGKLDRAALPDPTANAPQPFRAPATATEIRLGAMFGELFGVERVGRDDSFFDLGGHSMLAARLVTLIRAEFGVEVELRVPFDHPTVAGLAHHIRALVIDEFGIDLDETGEEMPATAPPASAAQRPPLTRGPRPHRIPLSYPQLAMWFQYRMDGPSSVGNLPFTIEIDGPVDDEALAAAINDVVARHSALRTTFPEFDGVPCQHIDPGMRIPVPITHVDATELEGELARIAGHAFVIDAEPLVRAELFVLGESSRVLSILMHHIVADHASFAVFRSEVIDAYRVRRDRNVVTHSDGGIEYADYALWQRAIFDDAGTDSAAAEFGRSEIEHWRTALAGIPDSITVATDHPRPVALGKHGEIASFEISAVTRNRLRELAVASGATEFMVCQAALATLLCRLGAGDDIALGTPVDGRSDPAMAGLVGLFANMVVLRCDLAGNPSVRTLLQRCRDTALTAFVHQEVPIERLVDALAPRRTRARNPLFQVMIHFHDTESAYVLDDAAQTTMTLRPVEFDTSFLDINVSFAVRPDESISARIVANSDLYESDTVEMLASGLRSVFEAFAAAPDMAVADIDVLGAERAQRVLGEWSRSSQTSPLPAVFDAEGIRLVAATPAAPVDTALGKLQALAHRECVVSDGLLVAPAAVAAAAARVPASCGAPDVRLLALPADDPQLLSEVRAGLAASATMLLVCDHEIDDAALLAQVIVEHQVTDVVCRPQALANIAHSGVSMLPSVRSWRTTELAPVTAEVLTALAPHSMCRSDQWRSEVCGEVGRRLVLDARMRPVPHNVVGELYLGGPALAVGYHDDPARTACRFVADPFARDSRLFRTGIPARWDVHGNVHIGAPTTTVVSEPVRSSTSAMSETERVLADLLAELLEIDEVAPDDGFFALGGDSVMSIQWAVRANELGVPLTPQLVFEHFTIRDLAAAVDDATVVEDHRSAPMSASGLSDAELAGLAAAWEAEG
ncbi:amino acid adenylation domain-containing protein [Skermania sp. ID1734]|uniref:non-ribosomal peptide synthetase n=1 Tax=Skermania sp. ID1734 TaxID=2597516 RepID=UPI00117C5622|nr:non-ribosomal peptide synthetase [Skermania sp. ID1734]TSE01432.1 amino acid adenylation domain-containing protein [Skermania sp. ID1734]